MEPIINPLWFYLIDVVDNLQIVVGIILILSCIALAIVSLIMFFEYSELYLEEQEKQAYFKYLKITLKVIIPCIIITSFTPSSDTIYKMIIADNITPHNIEVVGDAVEGGIDYIFEKINSLTLDEVEKDEG